MKNHDAQLTVKRASNLSNTISIRLLMWHQGSLMRIERFAKDDIDAIISCLSDMIVATEVTLEEQDAKDCKANKPQNSEDWKYLG